ncbi:MAG: deoxyribose-phosphate aldolase [Planctomycetes bacterium]|nr:deoxyribose-phosphate aldolase [Planctomycetota bacterium]
MNTAVTAADVARTIEHTLLRPEATAEQVDQLCRETLELGFHGACVNPCYVRRAAELLGRCVSPAGRAPVVVCPVGFPLGANLAATKADEARRAIDDGAREFDMVAPIGALIAGDRDLASRDILAVAEVVHSALPGGVLKVILETAVLTEAQIILACRCAAEGEADFVKTSTGFHPAGGATVGHVRLLHRYASPIKVKASGGIRTAATALAMLEAGAARIGTSSGAAIVAELAGGAR